MCGMNHELPAHLDAQLGRKLSREELALALDISVATLNRRKQSGFSADDVIAASRHFGLAPVGALVACGHLAQADVDAAAQSASIEGFSDMDIAQEIMRRVQEGTASRLASDPLDEGHPAAVSQADYTLATREMDDDEESEAQQEYP